MGSSATPRVNGVGSVRGIWRDGGRLRDLAGQDIPRGWEGGAYTQGCIALRGVRAVYSGGSLGHLALLNRAKQGYSRAKQGYSGLKQGYSGLKCGKTGCFGTFSACRDPRSGLSGPLLWTLEPGADLAGMDDRHPSDILEGCFKLF